MNFDRFKNEKANPEVSASVLNTITEKDAEYINSLKGLKYRQSNKAKILQYVYTTAAVFVAIVAFSLWAIIGRGIRGIQVPSSGGGKEYAVSVNNDSSIKDGLKQLQDFFDDYLTEKPSTLIITRYDDPTQKYMNIPEGEAPPLTTTTIVCNADGSGVIKYAQSEGSYAQVDFAVNEENFQFLKFVMEYNYLQFVTSNGSGKVYIDLSGLTNTYGNSKRVFDSSKAEPVTIQDGIVVSGEKSLQDFFESYISGLCCGFEMGLNTIFFDGDDVYHKRSPSGTELKCTKIDIRQDINNAQMVSLYAMIDFGENGDGFTEPFVSIRKDEIERLQLLFNSRRFTVNASRELSSNTVYNHVKELTDELKSTPPVEYKTALPDTAAYTLRLNDYVTFLIYKNEDGSIQDTFGLSSLYGGMQSVKVSDEFVKTVVQILTDVYGSDLSVITDEQRLKYFDFAQKYRFDYMPNFMEDDNLEITDIKWQIYAYLGFPKELKGEQFDKAANELYGITFNLDKNYNIPLEVGSYIPTNYMELTGYSCSEKEDGKKYVRLDYESYDYQEGNDSMPELAKAIKKSGTDTNDFIRTAIGDGNIIKYGQPGQRYTVCYYSEDGYTPQKFASCVSSHKDESGQWQSDMTSSSLLRSYAKTVRTSFEKWLTSQPDVLEYKTIDLGKAASEQDGQFISANAWYKIKVKDSTKNNWQYKGDIKEDGWIYGASKLLICKKDENGEYVYDPNIKRSDMQPWLTEYAKNAFKKYLDNTHTVSDYKILSIKVADTAAGDTQNSSTPYQVWVTYSVKPKLFFKSDWAAGNGTEGEDGWIENKMTVFYAKIENNEMIFTSGGTGP